MLILDNFAIVFVFFFAFFILLTYLRIYTHVKHVLTSLILMYFFFDLFFRLPFKFVNSVYNERHEFLKQNPHNKKTEKILNSKVRIFIAFYKQGLFSYSRVLSAMMKRYKMRPFRFRVSVSISNKRQSIEKGYIKDISKEVYV